jgi:urease accessory protein
VPEPIITHYADITPPGILGQPRAYGVTRLAVKSRAGRSVVDDLHQAGSLRLLFPRSGHALTGVLLNTAGGMTGGDRFTVSATAGDATLLTLTTQACERVYRAQSGTEARLTTTLRARQKARIDWLPQETIL